MKSRVTIKCKFADLVYSFYCLDNLIYGNLRISILSIFYLYSNSLYCFYLLLFYLSNFVKSNMTILIGFYDILNIYFLIIILSPFLWLWLSRVSLINDYILSYYIHNFFLDWAFNLDYFWSFIFISLEIFTNLMIFY